MERYHGTLKERRKVMRGMKSTGTSIIDGLSCLLDRETLFDVLRPDFCADL
jgi:hypothetical protein